MRTSAAIAGQADVRAGVRLDLRQALLEDGLVTEGQLAHAEALCAESGGTKSLETTLCELGYLFRRDLRRVFERRGAPVPLGILLVDKGTVPPSAVDAAVFAQRSGDKRPLGDLLVEKCSIAPEVPLAALAEQKKYPLVAADVRVIDRTLLALVPLATLERFGALPISATDKGVTIAFASPPDDATLRELSASFGRPVLPALAAKAQLAMAFRNLRTSLPPPSDRAPQSGIVERSTNIIELVDSFMRDAVTERVSDVHVEPLRDRLRIRFRVDGVLETRMELPVDLGAPVVSRIKVMSHCDLSERRRHQDGRFNFTEGPHAVDVRVSIFASLYGENVVMRVLETSGGVLRVEELGMGPKILERLIHEVLDTSQGVVIVSGPTGSGKTSTVYSAVSRVNKPSTKIITVEDPVEHAIDGIIHSQVNTKIGQTFEDGLRAILRQDPDVVLLGEVRDGASARVAMEAALTGHRVYTTLHAEDTVSSLVRLRQFDIEPFLIASGVSAIVAQRLVRKICPDCREPHTAEDSELLGFLLQRNSLAGFPLYRGRGCEACRRTGYRGRTALHEVLIMNDDLREALLRNATTIELRKIAQASAQMITLMEVGIALVARGITTLEEISEVPRRTGGRSVLEVLYALGYSRQRAIPHA